MSIFRNLVGEMGSSEIGFMDVESHRKLIGDEMVYLRRLSIVVTST